MANPIIIAKIASAVVSDKRGRKIIMVIVGAVIVPFLLLAILISSMFSSGANHNNEAIKLAFNNDILFLSSIPDEYKAEITKMRTAFDGIDNAVESINDIKENDSLDGLRVKAIFYSLYFGVENISVDYQEFADKFVRYEERSHTHTNHLGVVITDEYTVTIPIPLETAYQNIGINMEQIANSNEIYNRIKYGTGSPSYGGSMVEILKTLELSTEIFVGADGFVSPVGGNWRNCITSEFGYRSDPFTGETKGHSGIDLAYVKGTPVRVALDGKVVYISYSNTGYGYHIMVDHGGEFITLYAHMSKILVSEGQEISAGDIVGEVGTTGRSTGNHLHFEIINKGQGENPRLYLP